MRKTILTLFLNGFLHSLFAQSNIDVLHYKFEINLNDKHDTIYGKAEITISKYILEYNINFNLIELNSKGKGMIVDSVKRKNQLALYGSTKIDSANKISELLHKTHYKLQHDTLKLYFNYGEGFPYSYTVKDTPTYIIYYHGIPDDGLIISKNKFGDRTFFADNWPDRAHHWIPCVDDPADKATFEFIVTAPSQYEVISNGEKIEEKNIDENTKLTHWKEDIPLSTKIMVIGVAKFAVKQFSDSPKNIPVTAWVYPKDSVQGFKNYSVAPDILKFYSSLVAPYPYNKLANVQSTTIYGGMENASAIFYNELSASSASSVESLLAHEIAHQWFGDMVSEKNFAHLWLSEGFATYLQHLYTEKKYGSDSMKKEMKEDREQVIGFAKITKNAVVDSISPFRALLNPYSYQKGSWVLHMLRNQVGDSVFKKIIQSFYERYKGENANTRDLEAVVEDITEKNWKRFFDQWLYVAVIPQLQINWSYSVKKKTITLSIEQKQDVDFDLPLEFSFIDHSGKAMIKKININQPEQSFSFLVKEKPLRIEIDPHVSLLFSGEIKESKN